MGIAMALALGLLTAAPATAGVTVQSITFPGDGFEFYSPFGGPATITFAFTENSNNVTFNVRLRPAGKTAIFQQDVFVTPDEPEMVEIEKVSWPALTVNSGTEYVVAVYRNGTQVESANFFLRPPLASITGIAPNPFFPLIDNGHKDTTTVSFNLLEAASAEARVFRAKSNGACCGSLVRDEFVDPGQSPAGTNQWVWDGKNNVDDEAGVGHYFVKIWADDGTLPPKLSKPFKVSIARTYRATATKSKAGANYHHATESALVRGGDCALHKEGGVLQIDCHGSTMSVYYRWGLGSAQRIEKRSFVIDDPYQRCGPSKRSTGHSKHESYITVTDNVSGITSCHVVTAKITYSYPKAS
jgi:hypothetical protein